MADDSYSYGASPGFQTDGAINDDLSGEGPVSELYDDAYNEEDGDYDEGGFTSLFAFPGQVVDAVENIVLGAQDTVEDIFLGGQDTVQTVFTSGQDTAQQLLQGGQAAAERVLNPLGLAGLGAGLSVGAAGTVIGLGLVAGLVADELLAGGAGRTLLLRRLSGKRR